MPTFGYPHLLAVALAFGMPSGPARAQTPASLPPERQAYADFALTADADAARGQRLFADESKAACSKCHSTDGSASKAGPDLASVGVKFSRADLIRAVLQPSASIAVGYGTTLVETKTGESIQGIVKQTTDAWIELQGADGPPVRVATRDIRLQRTSDVSLMPEGLEATLTQREFADLIAFLESLRQPAIAGTDAPGMPARIPIASHAVGFAPYFSAGIRFEHPVALVPVPGAPDAFVVIEHAGKAWIVERAASGDTRRSLLDLSGQIRVGGATGLLGFAFHPRFAENRRYFLKYQILVEDRIWTVLVERRMTAEPRDDSAQPPRELLRMPSVTQDHNGGWIAFGPDGFLYLGMGDTGPQRDPHGHGQDLGLLLGKMLRIDIDHEGGGKYYAIPSDNPFLKTPGARPEIWAYGFREPWRFSFDRATGDLWVGDVGQDRIEEVGIVRAGENHGWNVFEGFTPFSDKYRRDGERYISPVFAYPHSTGVSITAGHVYRGERAPLLNGLHVCGDFETRRIWAVAQTNRVLARVLEIGRVPSHCACTTTRTPKSISTASRPRASLAGPPDTPRFPFHRTRPNHSGPDAT